MRKIWTVLIILAPITVFGQNDNAISLSLKECILKTVQNNLGLAVERISPQIADASVSYANEKFIPAGIIERGNYEVQVRIPGVYTNIDEIRNTVVVTRDGAPILLKEVASVDDTHQRITRIVRINGMPGTRIAINKQSGKNKVAVAEGVLKEIEKIQQDIPQIQWF